MHPRAGRGSEPGQPPAETDAGPAKEVSQPGQRWSLGETRRVNRGWPAVLVALSAPENRERDREKVNRCKKSAASKATAHEDYWVDV